MEEMREIGFRGKRIDDGKWVYGDLIQSKPNKMDGKFSSWIIEKTIMPFGAVSTPTEKFIAVIPETVGQYTGKKDKAGKEIYKGDIVEEGGEIGFIEWENDFAKYVCRCSTSSNGLYLQQMKIIGNIHENPELKK